MGLRSAIFLVVGSILGSGVFKKVAMMSATLQSPVLVLACWVLAGLISLAGALCTAEMCSLYPNSGGEYYYFQKVFNRFFAYLYGWTQLAVVKTASIAALAYVFAESFNSIFPLPEWSVSFGGHFVIDNVAVKLLASVEIIALSYVNYRGLKHAEQLGNFMTVLMLCAAAVIVGAGLTSSAGSVVHLTKPGIHAGPGLSGWPLIKAITIASLGAFWGYEGWNAIGYIGEEVKDPRRNIPLSLGFGTLIIMLVYVLLNITYLYVLPIDELIKVSETHNQIAAVQVMAAVWGKFGALFVALLILVTTFNATNATILSAARVYYAMARDGLLFRQVATVHPRYLTPSVSLGLQAVWSVLFIWSGTFDQLTDMLIFAAFIFYGASALGVMIMRRRAPEAPRAYKVNGYPWVPILFCLFCLLLIGVTLVNQPREALAGLGLMATGIPFYLFWSRKKMPPEAES
jgi:APA family basic amino acid/polyamine antiporter